ncbi:hypothetical protein JOD43_002620 [Pullulanibacillus pueri]|uniref:Acyltransferase 3 domain-containing protein n=1 Tax=Pullulanibacillus pueri TaxID=1437324 RepID=A0A8J2ZVJ9_9BACL|nr:acyltransferase [Pullulanibacillus pueri]MBM7682443.1 hypothetical protein [Pullulanibacillus pueri]GGH81619.1 hypothetical protein GCM10007096_19780 [Pullulanibacillus pueri]
MQRNYTIDLIKCFCMYLVVWFHAAPADAYIGGINGIYFHYVILLFPRFVVSYFFVVSGFLLGVKILNKQGQTLYVKRYLMKIIKLFVTWYLFYFIYDLIKCMLLSHLKGLDVGHEVTSFIYSQAKLLPIYYGYGQTSYQLWYLTALIWSILILSLFIKVNKIGLLLGIGFCLNVIGLFGQTYSGIFRLPINTNDALFYGLFYTTLGCFIAYHYEGLLRRIEKIKTSTFVIFFIIFSILGVGEAMITIGPLNGYSSGSNYNLSTLPLTLILFCVAIKNKQYGRQTIFTKIGAQAVGIYITHVLFLSIMTNLFILFNIESLQSYIAFHLFISVVIFITSYYFYSLLQVFKKVLSGYFYSIVSFLKKPIRERSYGRSKL